MKKRRLKIAICYGISASLINSILIDMLGFSIPLLLYIIGVGLIIFALIMDT